MRKTPLLDLGNVVIQVDFAPFLTWLAERSESKDITKLQGFLRSSLFYEFEFGSISRRDFTRRVASLYGAKLQQEEFEARFCDIFPGLVDGMPAAMEQMAKEGPLYALSNTNEVHLEWLMKTHPGLMKNFTRVFASHEMHKRKPYPGIYVQVAEELGVEPETLLFFDDVHANVEGALKAGLDAHIFSGPEQVLGLLKL